jgi:hypothetical protein
MELTQLAWEAALKAAVRPGGGDTVLKQF